MTMPGQLTKVGRIASNWLEGENTALCSLIQRAEGSVEIPLTS
jgi:hypothetical protein